MNSHLRRRTRLALTIGVAIASLAGLLLTGSLGGVVPAPWAPGGPPSQAAAFTLIEVGGAAPAGAPALVADPNGLEPQGRSFSPITVADVPDLVNLQGRLTDAAGNPVADGSYSIRFSIWGAPSGGSELWNETQSVSTSAGLFNVLLGSVTTLSRAVFDGSACYLELKVGADPPMTPRQRFATVPYAFFAEEATTAGSALGLSRLGFSTTTVDSAGAVGAYPSVTLGADGLPLISYFSNTGMKVVHCGNAACSAGNTFATADSAGSVGSHSSVTVGTDGLPIISYRDEGNDDLKVVHCGNAACSAGNTITTLDSVGNVGLNTSMTIGTDGLPIISYWDQSNLDLKVAHCGDVLCSSATITAVDSVGSVGQDTSVTVGADGLPIVSYRDSSNGDLKVAHCGNLLCNASNTITTVDSVGDVGVNTSVTIGTDGLPIISYYDFTIAPVTLFDLKVAHCGNLLCSAGNTITTVDSPGNVGKYSSITVGADGLPLVSYFDDGNDDLKVAHCGNLLCSASNTITTVDSVGDVGYYTSVTVGADGLPIISYWDGGNADLKVAHCSNRFCLPFHRPR